MGWFEKQIEQRTDLDQQLFEDSLIRVAGVVLGHHVAQRISDDRIVTKQTMDDLLKYYHLKPVEIPEKIKDPDEQMDYCLRPHGILSRRVTLQEKWYTDAYGPMIAYKKDSNEPVCLLPDKFFGYYYYDREEGKTVRINRKTEAGFDPNAYCFYRPLPQKKLKIPDLLLYMKQCISVNDFILLFGAMGVVTLVGLIMPKLMKALTGYVVSSRSLSMFIGTAICILTTSISVQLFSSIYSLISSRLNTKISLGVESAMMMRLMSLPTSFFRQYSCGELSSRSSSVNSLCSLLFGFIIGGGLGSLASLLYIGQIFSFARQLVIPSIVIILITVVTSTLISALQIVISKKQMEIDAKESGMSYAMLNGIQKIKLSGAEKRFFSRWLDVYAQSASLTYSPPMFIRINTVIMTAISLFSNIVLYYIAVKSHIGQSNYYAFTASYGMVMGAFSTLAGMALNIGRIKPVMELAEPFLEAEPEASANREIVSKLLGNIAMNNVSFRYNKNMPYVVKDLSLKIKAGEYVAIVGKTGCGKSTLIRLLLGFEKPEKGVVYYDGKDIKRLDLPSLRRKIGTVMQNGGLFQGDIYSNIVITAPQLTLQDAWEAAEIAGIADDIRDMPMGMNTLISEGQGGISGGQKQRLMIARAVAPKPRILIFDEATSALDNKTQKAVSEALDKMGCTRIVVAHRLSTIRHCDRILVFDQGSIIEEGTYDELISKGGFFASLVERQRTDAG
ncbi:MAG: ATP-binding cassette domain-containing protein [Lachnospiraceae bacterium]|nr:ATP-binding cassette domain-containing protein [Lachnospiraceae bacterium]